MHKFLDDMTLSEIVLQSQPSAMQSYMTKNAAWSLFNRMNINFNKTKEIIIGALSNSPPSVISINGNIIERVSNYKLQGVILDCTLKWHSHIHFICSKATLSLYFLKQLRRNYVTEADLYTFYTAIIRPVVEYTCPAWYSSLTTEQCNRVEHIQKRALSIIYGNTDYELFCEAHSIDSLCKRREKLSREFFKDIAENSDSCLHYLLPECRSNDVYKLKTANIFFIPTARTERYKNSFLMHAQGTYQNDINRVRI
jgi:hypothetical protein